MTALLKQAMAAAGRLPDDEQDALARELLQRLEADDRWAAVLKDSRSDDRLSRLVAEARAEVAAGNVDEDDPATRPAP